MTFIEKKVHHDESKCMNVIEYTWKDKPVFTLNLMDNDFEMDDDKCIIKGFDIGEDKYMIQEYLMKQTGEFYNLLEESERRITTDEIREICINLFMENRRLRGRKSKTYEDSDEKDSLREMFLINNNVINSIERDLIDNPDDENLKEMLETRTELNKQLFRKIIGE